MFFKGTYEKIFAVLILLMIFNFKGVCNETGISPPLEKEAWYTNIFAAGGIQTFMLIPALKDFAIPKPGYRFSAGYTFLHEKKHSLPLYIETGHSVISGTNPLVRTFDIFPLTVNLSYEYSPIKYFSVGAFGGGGVYFSQIQHYPIVLDILTNKHAKAKSASAAFNCGVTLGGNIIEKNIEFRAVFSCDMLLEKARIIPLPSFQLGVRMYPAGIYAYAQNRKKSEVIIKEAKPAVLQPKAEPKLPQFNSIYVYFEPESSILDVNAKAEIKKAAAILEKNKDIFILFEGSTAPFGNQSGRIKLENERILKTAEYLQKKCGIAPERIIYTEPFKNRNAKREDSAREEHYTQFRYVQLRFVRLQLNPDDGKNVYKTQGEKK